MLGRRGFLLGSAAIAGGVAFGAWHLTRPPANPLRPRPGEGALNPYVLVTREGVSIVTPRAEMGQGVHTTLAALVAEEMDLDWAEVRAIHGPASVAYANGKIVTLGLPFVDYHDSQFAELGEAAAAFGARLMGMQLTGGSSSTVDAFDRMRAAGAAARAALVEAAAAQLGMPAGALRTEGGAVVAPDGQRLLYTALAEAAVGIAPPAEPALKPRGEWRLLGRSLPRLDMAEKVRGSALFGIDVRLPGMLYAAVRANPHLGAPLLSFDASAAEGMPGVVAVLDLGDAMAAVAENTWAAMQGADAVEIRWAPAPYPADTDGIFAAVAAAFEEPPEWALRDDGDAERALAGADVVEAEYVAPYLAHTTMEPPTATALFDGGRLTIWTGTQAPTTVRDQAAAIAGIAPEAVTVNTTYLGGGFGRRAETDVTNQATRVALTLPGRPVKLTWTREEDIRHDFYRPGAIARLRGALGPEGPVALSAAVASRSIARTQVRRHAGIAPPGPDKFIVEGLYDAPYGVPNFRVIGHPAAVEVPVGFWRSVGHSFNTFFIESFLDELAHAGGHDPLTLRRRLLEREHPASARAVAAVGEMAGWGDPLPEGRARGVAFCLSYGTPTAQVVEVRNTDAGLRVEQVWCAVDVGLALDPRNVEAQIVSGVVYGLSAAISGEVTFAEGRVEQSNFHDCDALRIDRCPPIEVRILESGGGLGGVGEPGTPPIAPALANAIFALTGERVRRLPLGRSVRFA